MAKKKELTREETIKKYGYDPDELTDEEKEEFTNGLEEGESDE